MGELNNLSGSNGPANRHKICHHHVHESDSKFAKTPLKESASKYGALTPLKETVNRWDIWMTNNLRSAALNSLEWDPTSTSKNAKWIRAIKDATFGNSASVSPPW